MLKLLLVCSIIQFGLSSCPDGFNLVKDGQCRGEYMTLQKTHADEMYDVTVAKCNEINALPIIIHDDEEQNYWTNVREKDGSQPQYSFPIGLMCNGTTKLWQWSDGSALDYKPSDHDPALEGDCTSGCAWTLYIDGSWSIDCNPRAYWAAPTIFCTKQLHQPLQTGCGTFDRDDDDGVCYEIADVADTWIDAQMICKKDGADLASIHNSQENSFVRRLAVSQGAVSGVFLGATVSGKGNDFGWIDGSEWDYQNFYPGFPLTGFGQCLVMDTSTATGQWMNRDCSMKQPVVCIPNETKVAYNEPTCDIGPWMEGELITSPGYPYNASVPCEYFISVDKGKLVEAEILSLEANSCCDYLTIYDDYVAGKMIASISGYVERATFTSTTNYMKVVWQPNGGVNVRGMAMVCRGV